MPGLPHIDRVRLLGLIGGLVLSGGIALVGATDEYVPGLILIGLGTLMELAAGLIGASRLVRDLIREQRTWTAGARSATIVHTQPPRGLLERTATVTIERELEEGGVECVEHSFDVPLLYAIPWRLAGRLRGPISDRAGGDEGEAQAETQARAGARSKSE